MQNIRDTIAVLLTKNDLCLLDTYDFVEKLDTELQLTDHFIGKLKLEDEYSHLRTMLYPWMVFMSMISPYRSTDLLGFRDLNRFREMANDILDALE